MNWHPINLDDLDAGILEIDHIINEFGSLHCIDKEKDGELWQ